MTFWSSSSVPPGDDARHLTTVKGKGRLWILLSAVFLGVIAGYGIRLFSERQVSMTLDQVAEMRNRPSNIKVSIIGYWHRDAYHSGIYSSFDRAMFDGYTIRNDPKLEEAASLKYVDVISNNGYAVSTTSPPVYGIYTGILHFDPPETPVKRLGRFELQSVKFLSPPQEFFERYTPTVGVSSSGKP